MGSKQDSQSLLRSPEGENINRIAKVCYAQGENINRIAKVCYVHLRGRT
jgi:hypothetical protein